MKKSCAYIDLFKAWYIIMPLFLLILVTSCNPTKYVPKGESLLNKNEIVINKEGIKKSDLIPYIKQVPNKQIFGTRFYLGLYNLSNINKDKWPHNWLRNIGESPVIYDPFYVVKSKEQIKSYVSSKGYFDGIVTDTVKTSDRKSDVIYKVNLFRPYTIRNLIYEIADTNIRNLCYFDSVNCLIVRGKPYDVDVFQAERLRFERFIRDHGFYGFTNDFISFGVDSTVGNRQVDIRYKVRNSTEADYNNRSLSGQFAVYTVKNVYIYPDYVPKDALEQGERYLAGMDTTFFNGYYFVTSSKSAIRYDLILQSLYIKPGSVFNVTSTEQTQSHLLGLKVYRLVNINYNDDKDNINLHGLDLMLNCNIQLTTLSQQSYRIELEGTNSAGNLGGALNLVYQHKNLFHGAELLSMKLKGAYSVYKQLDTTGLRSVEEYGVETSLKFPKFMLPFFNTDAFVKKYNPYSTMLASYDYQNMPFYTRTIANASFGYDWKAGNYFEHIVTPLQLNLVNVLRLDSAFQARIDASSYQAFSYKDVLILGGIYSIIFNNQSIKNSRHYWFMRINAETAGNIMDVAEMISGRKKIAEALSPGDTINTYHVLGQPFAQYVKGDIDLRYYYRFNDASSIAYRGFVGIGIPYGNSREIPFEKQYFGGGANGIRAWQVRSLGPGSYNANPGKGKGIFLNETADIKLEANAEYRFKLFWILEGALFVDAGNIWTYNNDPTRPNAQFRFTRFYKDIAVGTGTGFRFDFKFVIARVDIGMKLRDPLLGEGALLGPSRIPDTGPKWIFLNGPYRRDDFTLVLGIGYPF